MHKKIQALLQHFIGTSSDETLSCESPIYGRIFFDSPELLKPFPTFKIFQINDEYQMLYIDETSYYFDFFYFSNMSNYIVPIAVLDWMYI